MWQRKTPEEKRCHRHILAPFRPTGKERYRNAADKGAIQVVADHRGWKGADYFRHIDRLQVGDNPTRSDGYNLMTLINHYMDEAQATGNIAARAKAEKYAKILAKTVVSPNGDTDYGQNAYFYDAAEGLLTSVVLLLAEFLPPDSKCPTERRHIVPVFKLVQELLAPSGVRSKNWFALLMDRLPDAHKARGFAGAALNTSEQAMAYVMSTVLSRLNAFLDSELEQVLCFDSAINAEQFAAEKSAIFLILPEEDQTKNFMDDTDVGARAVRGGGRWRRAASKLCRILLR